MNEIENNRKNLYDNLLGDGYFRDDEGNINFTFEDFCEGLNDIDALKVFYANLLDDGYFRDEDGSINFEEADFVEMLLESEPAREYYPITENQRGVYIDWEMNRDTTQYNIPEARKIEGVRPEQLRDALIAVVEAHPFLKTHFAQRDGDVVQLRLDEDPVNVSITDLDEEPTKEFFQRRVRPFHLLEGPLYRLEVYNTPAGTYLFSDFHHTIFDGGSSLIFAQHLEAVLGGEALEKERYSAFDRALAEAEFWQTEACRDAEQYFDNLLADQEVTVYPSSNEPKGEALRQHVIVDVPSADILTFCRNSNVTESNYFLTLFMQVLHRVTREEKVMITTIHHGRTDMRMLESMGMFVKTQPVVSTCTGADFEMPISEVIQQTQQQVLKTQSHDIYSFTKMVERYGLRAEIMYVFQGGMPIDPTANANEEESISLSLETAKMPLTFMVYPKNAHEFSLLLEYDGSLYTEKEMQVLGSMLQVICTEATHDKKIKELPVLSKTDQQKILTMSAGVHRDYDTRKTFIQYFSEVAAQQPDAIAVADVNSRFTYGELDQRSNALAHILVEQGVQPNAFVCILMERRKEFVLAVHGIHKAGAAYTPLDMEYPVDRLQYMLENSESKVLLTARDVLKQKEDEGLIVDQERVKVLFVEEMELDTNTPPICLTTPENVAYMIYTSGSTGKPKGAMLHQRGLMNFTYAHLETEHLTPADRIASHRSFSFDAHLDDLYPILAAGGELHIMPSEIRKDLDLMRDFLEDRKITGFGSTTSLVMLLINNYDLSLRFITAGGEKLSGVKSDQMTIINLYGPTECTNDTSLFIIKPGEEYENIPIGRPLPNVYCYILDRTGNLLPQGIPGELCISGAQVGYGYWRLPEMTSRCFVDCPFNAGKMYHTGDLVRYNASGQLEILGRIDGQVKLRGFRIEVGEIEATTLQHPAISQAVAQVKELNGARHLILYYTTEEGASVTEEELAAFLDATSLAKYMLPEIYMELEKMPVLPNAKINRKALPMPEIKVKEIVPPANETEEQLLALTKELLHVEAFGVTTNLISLGLTSLTAMRLSAVIQQRMEVTIPTKELLTQPTIRQMASYLSGNTQEQTTAKAWEKQDYYPITENQRGVYVDWEMNREALQYNLPAVIPMPGKDAKRLQAALIEVVNAHAYLKTRLKIMNGDIQQQRQDDLAPCVDLIQLDHEPENGFFQSRVRPFDLLKDRLYRLEIYQTPTMVYLFQDIHHIIFDGGSNLLFMDDVLKAYNGTTLSPETYTAYDHALDEKVVRTSEAYQEAESYYDQLIEEAETAVLPHYGELDANHLSKANAYVDVNWEGAAINRYCRERGLTANNFFLTALMQVLHRLLSEKKLTICTISNGRSNTALMNAMGMFVQTLPVVSTHEPRTSTADFATLAQRMQDQSMESQSRDFYPFTAISTRHGIRPSIMYIYQGGMHVSEETITTLQNSVDLTVDLDAVKVPLAIMIGDSSKDNFHVNFEYSTELYNHHDIQLLADSLKNFIEGVLANKNAPVVSIPLMDPEAQLEMIRSSYGGTLAYDKQATLVTHIQEHAATQPESIAVVDEHGALTYRELDQQSDLVATLLTQQGIEVNQFVGIMLPRRKEFITAIVGILKAGAAYIPIDASYPQERIQYMIENSEAKIVIDEAFLKEMEAYTGTVQSVNKATPTGLAYMIYTSGSTGKPKGVMQTHRSLSAFIAWRMHAIGITAESRHAEHASFSFDASLDDLLCPLAAGGTVHILSEALRMDMDGMYHYLKDNGITGMTLSTQMGMTMLNAYNDLPLQYLMMGGEKLLPFQKTPIRVINGYGPTEFTVCSSFHVVDQDKDVDIPIGRPVPNTWSLICDPYGNLLPQGEIGELCLAGPQIAEGYWKREEQTAEKFVSVPFELPQQRMYRTGDLARYNNRGELEFVGRIDNMIKLRGFRIELGEIENRAYQYEGMRHVAAEVKTVGSIQHLVLYFTADQTIDKEALRLFMAETLTEYMVPTIFMQLEEMPFTPNGKLNRKELPEPSLTDSVENLPPENEKEAVMLQIAYELLGHEGFGVTDNLMLQGLTSLLGIKMVALASKHKIEIKLDDLMRTKTIRGLLQHNTCLAFWYNAPKPGKPIVVVTCGETPFKNMLPYINALSETYSVFIIESILEHYKYIFEDADINEVIEMYYALIDLYVGMDSEIKCFTGHCFGGELSYRLANKWKKDHPESQALIVLLDVFWRIPNEQVEKEDERVRQLLPPAFLEEHAEEIKHFMSVRKMYNALNTNDDPEIYEGKIVLFRAMCSEPASELFRTLPEDLIKKIEEHRNTGRKVDNEAFWKGLYPTLECVHVEANHMSMLLPEHVGEYVDWITNHINHD